MPRRYLFVGPSLPDAPDLIQGRDIVVLPPVAAGDLLRLDLPAGAVVGIVDGYFHQARAIPHKEIMHLLGTGVGVLGAASMGALRAAELAPWGMRGIGEIFAAYRDGALVADDEVALLHGAAEDGYPRLSEPMVNIRATLAAAVAAGHCSAEAADGLVQQLCATPYRDRSYRRLAHHAPAVGLDQSATKRLVAYCSTNPVDRKRADAEQLLVALAAATPPDADRTDTSPQRTIYLRDWQLAVVADDLRALRLCQVLADGYAELHRATVVDALREDCRRQCGEPDPDPDPVRHGAHRGWYPDCPQWIDVRFLDRWTTTAERAGLELNELLTRFLVRSYRIRPGIADTERALASFRRHPARERALRLGPRVEEVNRMGREHRPDFEPAEIAADQVVTWLARRWSWPADELELAAFDRGFTCLAELVDAARPAFLAAQCDPETRAFTLRPEQHHDVR
jgi:hypothetical protein